MLLAFLLACGSDIAIITKQGPGDETGEPVVVDTYNPEPSSDPSAEPATEPSSELQGTVGLVVYELEQVACPACMGVSQEITISFDAKFHSRMNEQHLTWVPENGTCAQNLNYTTINVSPLNIGQSLTVQGGQTYFSPYFNGSSYYGSHQEPQYSRDTLLSIIATDGSAFQLMSLHGFDTIEPWEMRYVDPSYAFAAVVSKNGTNFSWAPYGSNSLLNITVAVYSQDGSQLLGYVSCTSNDTGNFLMPGNYFQGFPTWSLTAIHMTRVQHQRVPYEALGGYVDAQVEWSVVGTGHIE